MFFKPFVVLASMLIGLAAALTTIQPIGAYNELGSRRIGFRVTAILREHALLKIVGGTTLKPVAADPDKPTPNEKKQKERWEELDGRAQTQIEPTLSDSQMAHIAGAKTAAEMWKQLQQVKERVHVTELRRIQEEARDSG
ncbi:hypothetical protein B0H13DRAFT_2687568 [Mycena leptocephala]|nr:hypothetical protein B0H13DRAFT_2687568 [Mycena leptocephala]